MFVDACAIIAVLCDEKEAERCSRAIAEAEIRQTSPIAVLEVALALARPDKFGVSVETAERMTLRFLADRSIAIRDLPPALETVSLAALAAQRFRSGRQGLNIADCFHYACAKHAGMPILAADGEFRATDLDTVP